jgi:hypothetical protein
MKWIYTIAGNLRVGEKFMLPEIEGMVYCHKYYTVLERCPTEIIADMTEVMHHCPTLVGEDGYTPYKKRFPFTEEVIIRPDAPLHCRPESLDYCYPWLWPYDVYTGAFLLGGSNENQPDTA